MSDEKKLGLKHIINGIWTLSIIEDLSLFCINLRKISHFYTQIIFSIFIILTIALGNQEPWSNIFEQSIVYFFIFLSICNISSLLLGVYSTLLLIPDSVSWLTSLMIITASFTSYLISSIKISNLTKQYKHPFNFDLMQTIIVGLTGLAVIEDIMFLMQKTHLFLISLQLPFHLSFTLLSLTMFVALVGLIANFILNKTYQESFAKHDWYTFSFFFVDSVIKTMTIITIASCIWFNITLIPINNLLLKLACSLMLTAGFSYLYFYSEKSFNYIRLKNKTFPKKSGLLTTPINEKNSGIDNKQDNAAESAIKALSYRS